MKRMGRPPAPETERLKQTLHPRVADPVYDALDRHARSTGKSINTIAREVLTWAAPRVSAILNSGGPASDIP